MTVNEKRLPTDTLPPPGDANYNTTNAMESLLDERGSVPIWGDTGRILFTFAGIVSTLTIQLAMPKAFQSPSPDSLLSPEPGCNIISIFWGITFLAATYFQGQKNMPTQ